MAYIRATESIKLRRMSQCARAYPHLATLVDPLDPNARTNPGMLRLREHAVELSHGGITEKYPTRGGCTEKIRTARCAEN